MTAPAGHEDELPLDSPDDFPADADDAPEAEAAPWADGPGHVDADELPPPVEGVGELVADPLSAAVVRHRDDTGPPPEDEVPLSPS